MKIICILPSDCNSRSNGILILVRIYQYLLENAPSRATFVCHEPDRNTTLSYINAFGKNLKIYNSHTKNQLRDALVAEKFVLVRPDDLEGINNPMHWELASSESSIRIVNILLAPPYAFARSVSILSYYCKKDLFLLANQAVMPAFAGMEKYDLFIEQALDATIWDFVNLEKRSASAPVAFYIGKGVFPLIPSLSSDLGFEGSPLAKQNIVLIKRSWPTSKAKLYSILASSRCLISCDPFSHIERVSTLLGTPVIKTCDYNLRELPGVDVAYGSLSVCLNRLLSPAEVHAKSFDHYQNALAASRKSLSRIVLSILKAATPVASAALQINPFVPYEERCMFAFSSQLRLLLPFLADFKTTRYGELISKAEFLEIVSSVNELGLLTPSKLSCILEVKRACLQKGKRVRPVMAYQDAP